MSTTPPVRGYVATSQLAAEEAAGDRPKLTPAQRSEAFTGSEHYAAGRMTHDVITGEKFNRTQSEVVHDALMAAFQAGFLAAAEGTSVDELLRRMAEID